MNSHSTKYHKSDTKTTKVEMLIKYKDSYFSFS